MATTARPEPRSLDLRAPRAGFPLADEAPEATALLAPSLRGRPERRSADAGSILERLKEDEPAFAWFAPDGAILAGFGAVARFEGSGPRRFEAAKRWLDGLRQAAATENGDALPPLIAVGGFSYAVGSAGAPAGFGDAVFFVPAELWTTDAGIDSASWRRADGEQQVLRTVPAMARPSLPQWNREEWASGVRALLSRIEGGALEKAVLARAVEIESKGPIDPAAVLASLIEANPECFRFLVRPSGRAAFLGASPERLVALRDGRVVSDAVAGTAEGSALLESGKDRSEHAFVVRHIVDALTPLAESVEADAEPSLQRHRHLAHLKTRIAGRARPGAHLLDFVERVHPTPAVAGSPRDAALEAIRALEPSHRGWYAGAVGWFDANGEGDFTVGIRSALIQERRALLFAGAGIVAGSDPDAEWAETEVKLSVMREAIADAAR